MKKEKMTIWSLKKERGSLKNVSSKKTHGKIFWRIKVAKRQKRTRLKHNRFSITKKTFQTIKATVIMSSMKTKKTIHIQFRIMMFASSMTTWIRI